MIARVAVVMSLLAGCQGLADECVPPATTYTVEPRLDQAQGTCPFDAYSAYAIAFDGHPPTRVTGESSCTTRKTTGTASMPPSGCTVSYMLTETFDDLGGIGSVHITTSCDPDAAATSCEVDLILIYHPDPPQP